MISGLVRLTFVLAALVGCNDDLTKGIGDEWEGPLGTWAETWRDDFDGPEGSGPDAAKWNVAVRLNNDNEELQAYTNRRENSYLDGNGNLVLKAIKESYQGKAYTSGKIDTRGKYAPKYGRVEARIKLPSGKGVWPAFWMLGQNFGQVGWPKCGEIDVLEVAGSKPGTIHGSLHGPDFFGTGAFKRMYRPEGVDFSQDFHVYAYEWTSEGMRWLVDEQVYHTRTREGFAELERDWVFDQPFYLILNVAVGGHFDGDPDATTEFPKTMTIDYVRVFRLEP